MYWLGLATGAWWFGLGGLTLGSIMGYSIARRDNRQEAEAVARRARWIAGGDPDGV